MATVNQITQNIIAQARLLDPNISLEIGTPERKIVEAVAESIASASVDIEVLSGQLYLDELSGARIDSFLSLFGFGRQLGSRATGVVTVSRDSVATYDATIPKGTQFSTRAGNGIPNLIFIATETVVLRANETRALVRVECTTSGTVGNIPAGTIDGLPNSINIPGVSRVVNETATLGGIDTETDEKFKTRFQNTIFRNMAGTSDQHYALALSHPSVSKANVIGPQSRYTEYLQVPAVADQLSVTGPTGPTGPTNPYYPGNTYTTSISSVPYSKYTFSNNYYVAKGTGKNAKFLRPGKDFILNNPASLVNGAIDQSVVGNPVPNITLFGDSTTVDGTLIQFPEEILLFEHTYLSRASRNDWSRNIYNCVDVYVNGELPQAASSEESFPSLSMQFVNDSESVAYYKNYVRAATNETPALGNRLQVLYFQPVVDLIGTSITINETVYFEGTDYYFVKDVSTNGGTVRARDGIEWLASVGTPGSNTFNVDYYFDLAISQLQAVMERSKQITTDVLVHATKYQYFKLYITVMYTPGFTEENVNLQIYSSLLNFFNTQYYGTTIQMSDLLQAIHNTSGVDNVRWTYPAFSIAPIDWSSGSPTVARTSPSAATTITYNSSSKLIQAGDYVEVNIAGPSVSEDVNGIFLVTSDSEVVAGQTYSFSYNSNGDSTISSAINSGTIALNEHKIEVVTKAGVSFSEPIYQDGDFILNDDELPSLPDIANGDALANALVIERKAQNTWETN
jgi:uncharacterized phage protein gp47/JayE